MLKTNALFCALAMVLSAGCQTAGPVDPMADPRLTEDDVEARAANSAPDVPKGMGGVNGGSNYCNNGAALCANGEGDCDKTSQCQAGLICIPNQGPRFGLGASVDVCMPATCANRRLDPGEIVTDCGGGGCPPCARSVGSNAGLSTKGSMGAVNGSENYCNDLANSCAFGEGDCDNNAQCGAGLSCIPNAGPKVGLASNVDVCLPSTCFNRVLDVGEIVTDCGGTCPTCTQITGAKGSMTAMPGSANFCVDPTHTCSSGEGGCRNNAQCDMGLICTPSVGAKFGFSAGTNVCLPATCSNRVRDTGEGSIDCGGTSACGPCPVGTATCTDGIRNGHETGVDCGGICDACVMCAGIRNGNFATNSEWMFSEAIRYDSGSGADDPGFANFFEGFTGQLFENAICRPAMTNAISMKVANATSMTFQIDSFEQTTDNVFTAGSSYKPFEVCLGATDSNFNLGLEAGSMSSSSQIDDVALVQDSCCPTTDTPIKNPSFDNGGDCWYSSQNNVTFAFGDATIDGTNCGHGEFYGWVLIAADDRFPQVDLAFDNTLHGDAIYVTATLADQTITQTDTVSQGYSFCPTADIRGKAVLIKVTAGVTGDCTNSGGSVVFHGFTTHPSNFCN